VPRTYQVLGLGRGGTSAICAILHSLGIPVAIDWKPGLNWPAYCTYEDTDLNDSLRVLEAMPCPTSADTARLRAAIEKRNAAYSVWGFKTPFASRYQHLIAPLVRNLHVIYVGRDLVAILGREVAYGDWLDLGQWWRRTLQLERMLLWWLSEWTGPLVCVSYERLLKDPERAIRKLSPFLRVSPNEVQLAAACAAVTRPGK